MCIFFCRPKSLESLRNVTVRITLICVESKGEAYDRRERERVRERERERERVRERE